MPSSLEIIWNVNDNDQNGRLSDFLKVSTATDQQFVAKDNKFSVLLRPVIPSLTADQEGGRPWDDDHVATDTYEIGIGEPDGTPTSGTFTLTIGATSIAAQQFDVSAATLQTALNAAWVTAGYTGCTVAKLATGVYSVTGTNDGVAVPAMTASGTGLVPACDVLVTVLYDGDETPTTLPQQIVELRQQLYALSEPSTALTAAGVTRTYDQTAGATQNNIIRISFNADGTYGGKYSITAYAEGVTAACGQAGPLMSAAELGRILANHPSIAYQGVKGGEFTNDADNIIPTVDGPDFLVEFTGTLSGVNTVRTINDATVANPTELTTAASHNIQTGDSVTITNSTGTTPSLNGTYTATRTAANKFTIPLNVTVAAGESATVIDTTNSSLTVANVSLLAPLGVTGEMNLNTFNLFYAFSQTTSDTINTTLAVRRTRVSGESRESLQIPCVLKREIIDVTSLVPVTGTGALRIGKMLFVDSVYGLDTNTGNFGAPFLTLGAAKTAAASGDTIHVFPGSYTITASLAKAGVNWYFEVGATVSFSDGTGSAGTTVGIWDDGGASMTFKVTGSGVFNRVVGVDGNAGAPPTLVSCSHASSNISIECYSLNATTAAVSDDGIYAIFQDEGTLKVTAKEVVASGPSSNGIWWDNGALDVRAFKITQSGAAGIAVYGLVGVTPTGDMNVQAEYISGNGNFVVGGSGNQTTSAMWVRANRIENTGTGASVALSASMKMYIEAQKLFGHILVDGSTSVGLLYVRADKVSAIKNGSSGAGNSNLFDASGANAICFIDVNHWDSVSFTGETFQISGSTHTFRKGGNLKTASATAKGIIVSGGTVSLCEMYINTAANSSTSPITKSGGTLKLYGCTLVAEATADSIEAGTAQNVMACGTFANRPDDANVTQTVAAGWNEDTDVS